MIKLKNGQKLKSSKTNFLFEEEIYSTKVGWVWAGVAYSSLFLAEEAILSSIRERNKSRAIKAFGLRNAPTRQEANQWRNFWKVSGGVGPVIWWDGGLAVAVKLDNLGQVADYLSLDEWKSLCFQLPSDSWHMLR